MAREKEKSRGKERNERCHLYFRLIYLFVILGFFKKNSISYSHLIVLVSSPLSFLLRFSVCLSCGVLVDMSEAQEEEEEEDDEDDENEDKEGDHGASSSASPHHPAQQQEAEDEEASWV